MKALCLLRTLAALLASVCLVSVGRGALVNFDAAGDLAANFTTSATPPFAEADSVGVGGSRALQVTGAGDSGATLQTSSFIFNNPGAKIQVSAYFHTATAIGTTGEDRVFELNLVGLATNIPTGAHTGVGGKIEFIPNADGNDTVGVEFRRNNADAAGSQDADANAFDIQPAKWYKATFTATHMGGGPTIPVTMVLDDYGATGTALVTPSVYSHSFTIITADSALASDGQVFAALRLRNGTRLLDAIDNYEAVQLAVPEPASLTLLGLAGCGLWVRRRR